MWWHLLLARMFILPLEASKLHYGGCISYSRTFSFSKYVYKIHGPKRLLVKEEIVIGAWTLINAPAL